MKLLFTKMQALGNDFILIDNRNAGLKKISQLSKNLCNRRFGIGADQLLMLNNSKKADFKMRIFNADGSEVEMCGNGIRCLAKHIWDNKFRTKNQVPHVSLWKQGRGKEQRTKKRLAIETLAGIMHVEKTGSLIEVDMGEPILEPEKIPVSPLVPSTCAVGTADRCPSSLIKNHPLKIKNKTFKITCISMGNTHAVIVVKDVNSVSLETYGHLIENHRIFPKRTNVEFIQIKNRGNIIMRVWERGAGETMACGTGTAAAAVASALLGLTYRKITVHLLGGKLLIDWSAKDNHVYMTGSAVTVFEGMVEV